MKIFSVAKDKMKTMTLEQYFQIYYTGAFEAAKAEYLQKKMEEIEEVQTVKFESVDYEEGHPTEEGTRQFILQMNDVFKKEIILNDAEKDITTPRKYSHVTPVYKVGCRVCHTKDYTAHLCVSCLEQAKKVDASYLTDMINKLQDEMFPCMNGNFENDVDIDMKKLKKRGHSGTSQNDDESSRKSRLNDKA